MGLRCFDVFMMVFGPVLVCVATGASELRAGTTNVCRTAIRTRQDSICSVLLAVMIGYIVYVYFAWVMPALTETYSLEVRCHGGSSRRNCCARTCFWQVVCCWARIISSAVVACDIGRRLAPVQRVLQLLLLRVHRSRACPTLEATSSFLRSTIVTSSYVRPFVLQGEPPHGLPEMAIEELHRQANGVTAAAAAQLGDQEEYPTWCKLCDNVKPPRTHHCHVSNRCVLRMGASLGGPVVHWRYGMY